MSYSDRSRAYFEREYSKADRYWGDQPNLIVPMASSHLRPHSRVLVVGCGEGRDALFLARFGFDVVGTDIAESGLKKINALLKGSDLKLRVLNLDAHEPHVQLGSFNAVFMMNVLQFFDPAKTVNILKHFQSLVIDRGLMTVQVFTTEDPQYQSLLAQGKISSGDLVVEHPTRNYAIRFFEKRELASYFDGWELIYYNEGLMWDKPHGAQTDFHQHGLAQIVARKKAI